MNTLAIALDRNRTFAASMAILLSLGMALALGGIGLAPAGAQAPAPVFIESDIFDVPGNFVKIIIQKWSATDPTAEQRIEELGGKVTLQLPIVDGFSAEIPADRVADLEGLEGARSITLDRRVQVQGSSTDSSNLKSVYPKAVRATNMWKKGHTGEGVTVALIDTGITEVTDISGRVLPVYDDLTGEWSPCLNLTAEDHCNDSYGHGTFMAGIIAGDGAASNGTYEGTAPDANLVSIKIAGYDGSADVSRVLAAIQWTVTFRERYGIKVLNLSLGTNGTGSYETDPLNYAVQRAWNSGIVVVVSASNLGPDPQTISKPADDPWVITVGAIDDVGTVGYGDDTIPNFSARGPTAADGLAKPDLVAPGGHIVSLRAPGSAIDTEFPNYIDDHYRRGSGTSMSAAVVSGSVATMLEADPTMSPNRVKYALMSTAKNVASDDEMTVGKGIPNVYDAAFNAPAGEANFGLARSSGLGGLDATRGDVMVQADNPELTIVSGVLTLQLLLWDPVSYTSGDWSGSAWYGSAWYGSAWYGSAWYGSAWYGSAWYGSAWYGEMDGSAWYGSAWYGSAWYGAWE